MANYPSSIASFPTLVNGVDYVLAEHQNTRAAEIVAIETYLGLNPHLPASTVKERLERVLAEGQNVETKNLSDNLTLTDADKCIQKLVLDANRDVTLPANASSNHWYLLSNESASAYTATIKMPDTTTLVELEQGSAALVFPVGSGVWAVTSGSGGVASKGRVEFLSDISPVTSGVTMNVLSGASSPPEQFAYWEFVNGSVTYHDYLCRLVGYNGGGLTFSGLLMRTSAGAGDTYVLEAAIRRINAGSEDLGAAHTYDFNQVTVTIPAGPPNAGIPMSFAITFTDGADMDNLADGEFFFLRIRRNGGTAADTSRLLVGISGVET